MTPHQIKLLAEVGTVLAKHGIKSIRMDRLNNLIEALGIDNKTIGLRIDWLYGEVESSKEQG
jgi:hypothetical protein